MSEEPSTHMELAGGRHDLVPRAWGPPTSRDIETLTRLSLQIASTEFVPKDLRNRPEAVLAAQLYGREVGVGPMNALNKIHVIDGRPTMSAELMRALVAREGHTIRPKVYTSARCVLVGVRADDPDHEVEVEWTVADAQAAELVGKNCDPATNTHDSREVTKSGRNGTYTKVECGCKDNWRKHPKAMLLARATSDLCRLLFPDVLAGISYTPDEIGGHVVDITDDGMIVYGPDDIDPEDADDPEDRSVPPPGVDGVAFRKDLFRRYRRAVDVARCHVDADVDLDERRAELLEGSTVKVASRDKLADHDPNVYGQAFADAPLTILRQLVDDVEEVTAVVEADGRCGYQQDGRRCALEPGHDEGHMPGDPDTDDGGPQPPDDEPEPGPGVDGTGDEDTGPDTDEPDDGPEPDPDATAADVDADSDGGNPRTEPTQHTPTPDEPDEDGDQPSWADRAEQARQRTGAPLRPAIDMPDGDLARSTPKDIAARFDMDIATAAECIADAQDRLSVARPQAEVPQPAPETPTPAPEPRTDPTPLPPQPERGSDAETASESVTKPAHADAFVKVMEGAGDTVAGTPVPEVVDKVVNGEWKAKTILAVELALANRKTLVPQLKGMCSSEDIQVAQELAAWWEATRSPAVPSRRRAVDQLADVEPGTPAFSRLRDEFARRINDGLADLRKADREAAELYGPRVADLGNVAQVPMAGLAGMVDEIEEALADAE